jgi:subtilase family serine protease
VGLVRRLRAWRQYRQMSARLAKLDRHDRKASAPQGNVIPLASRRRWIRKDTTVWRNRGVASGPGDRRSRWAAIGAAVTTGLLLAVWVVHLPRPGDAVVPQCVSGNRLVTCPYTPAQIRTAYDIQPLLDHGIDGRGRTVVLYEQPVPPDGVAHASNIYQDLAAYDQRYGLPPASLRVVSDFARSANPALANPEEVLDAELVHVVAPQTHIQVLLVPTRSEDFPPAVRYALTHQLGDVISFSLGFGEDCFSSAQAGDMHAVIERAAAEGVTLVASSGDYGAVGLPCQPTTTAPALTEVDLPASDPLVTAVGGTQLVVQLPSGRYRSETAWNSPPPTSSSPTTSSPFGPDPLGPDPFGSAQHSTASGGGFSHLFPRPDYQTGVPGITEGRGVPDVAADADPDTPIAIVSVLDGRTVLTGAGGTSAGAPLWAGLAALADQAAGRRLGALNPALYGIAENPQHSTAFHDITAGTNTVVFPPRVIPGYSAGPGWDPVTGWGSPDAAVLIPLLAHNS